MGSAREWIAAGAAALLVVGVLAAPSAGRRRDDPIAHVACEVTTPPPCSESGPETFAPNTYGSQQTDVVPAKTRSATVNVQPGAPADDPVFGDVWETMIQSYPEFARVKGTFARRVVICHVFSTGVANLNAPVLTSNVEEVSGKAALLYEVLMSDCLRVVSAMQRQVAASPPATTSSVKCAQVGVALPIEVKRVGKNKFVEQATKARLALAGKRGALRFSCRASGAGVLIGVAPTRRGARLGPVVGPHLQIGFANSGKSTVAIRNTYTFH